MEAPIIGYEMARQAVDLAWQPSVRRDFRLAPAILMGEEVTVTAQRQRVRRAWQLAGEREVTLWP